MRGEHQVVARRAFCSTRTKLNPRPLPLERLVATACGVSGPRIRSGRTAAGSDHKTRVKCEHNAAGFTDISPVIGP
jgi:hypothetical protein